jgi:hypothetical protein
MELTWDTPSKNRWLGVVTSVPLIFFLIVGWAPGLHMAISSIIRYGLPHDINIIFLIVWFGLWTGLGLMFTRIAYVSIRGGGPTKLIINAGNLSYRPQQRMFLQFNSYMIDKDEITNLKIFDFRNFRGSVRAAREKRLKILFEESGERRNWWRTFFSMPGTPPRSFMNLDDTIFITFDAGGYRYFLGSGLSMPEKEWLYDQLKKWLELKAP